MTQNPRSAGRGALPCESQAYPRNPPVEIMQRPDDFALSPDERGRGVVTAHEFRGAAAALRVKPDSGVQIRRRHSFSTLPAGARVELSAVRTIWVMAYGAG